MSIITPEEIMAEVCRLHDEVVDLVERVMAAEATGPVCVLAGSLSAVEAILESLRIAGVPLTDFELQAMALRRRTGKKPVLG